MLRQPIISVLGHVDHGKTSLLDRIRGTTIAEKEAGKITQHIGATEIPKESVEKISKHELKKFGFELKIKGLLFIDTPGHEAFTNLRKRGGSIADLALLVIDLTQGIQPQTIEAIEILKSFKTPFIIAATKLDKMTYWDSKPGAFLTNLENQQPRAKTLLDEKIYQLVGKLHEKGFQSERFDRCDDFRTQIAIMPISNKTGEGIPELLMLISGLSQKFMGEKLKSKEKEAKATVLEVREEKGCGMTVDIILYDGLLEVNDYIVLGGKNGIIKTKIRALLKPAPLTEIRDKKCPFKNVKTVNAACGIKISAPGLDDALPGSPLLLAKQSGSEETIKKEVEAAKIEKGNGIIIKASSLGSLEALVRMLQKEGLAIGYADVGNVSKKDVMAAQSVKTNNPLNGVMIAFGVELDEYAEKEAKKTGVKIFKDEVIYKIIEDYNKWRKEQNEIIKKAKENKIIWPAKLKVLKQHIFRNRDPAVFGVYLEIGRIKPSVPLLNPRGQKIGKIIAIQKEGKVIKEAFSNEEVAISVDKGVIGRNIREDDWLYTRIPEKHFEIVHSLEISNEEIAVLNEIKEILEKTEEKVV